MINNITSQENLPPQKKGETILQWFCRTCKDKRSAENVIHYISTINARILLYDTFDEDTKANMKKEIVEFVTYICKTHEGDETFYRKMRENWPDMPPRVMRMAQIFEQEDRIKDAIYTYRNFDNKRKKNTNVLADYIWNIRQDREISMAMNDGRSESFELSRTIPREYIEDCREWLDTLIVELLSLGGSLILRYVSPKKGARYIINGFRIKDGSVEVIKRDELKYCMELQPDGSMICADNEDYRIAPLIFAQNNE